MMKSTNKWTDIFIAFIKANRSLLIIYMLNIIVFSSVYILGRLPFYFLRFSIELSLFLGSCFFVFQFSRYYKRFRLLERLDKDPIHALKQLAASQDPSEAFLRLKIVDLIKEIQQIERNNVQRSNSQMDYFTLWLHQIKTPISAISLLMQRDSQMNYRHQMEQELLRIENYTHMALNYVRIEQSGTDLDFADVSLDRVIKETVKNFRFCLFTIIFN